MPGDTAWDDALGHGPGRPGTAHTKLTSVGGWRSPSQLRPPWLPVSPAAAATTHMLTSRRPPAAPRRPTETALAAQRLAAATTHMLTSVGDWRSQIPAAAALAIFSLAGRNDDTC